jgi:hypothetical protein
VRIRLLIKRNVSLDVPEYDDEDIKTGPRIANNASVLPTTIDKKSKIYIPLSGSLAKA